MASKQVSFSYIVNKYTGIVFEEEDYWFTFNYSLVHSLVHLGEIKVR